MTMIDWTSFRITAAADPQSLPRLLNYFTQRDLLPSRVSAFVDEGKLDVSIELPGLDWAIAQLVAEKMRSSILVENVILAAPAADMIDRETI